MNLHIITVILKELQRRIMERLLHKIRRPELLFLVTILGMLLYTFIVIQHLLLRHLRLRHLLHLHLRWIVVRVLVIQEIQILHLCMLAPTVAERILFVILL